jgi:hypothetical protein
LELDETGDHLCYITPPKIKTPLEDNTIWAFDIEARQDPYAMPNENMNVLLHECIHVNLRQVYTDVKYTFPTMKECCDFIMLEKELDNATIFAHNASGYDSQYVLQYCEAFGVQHSIIPHASSQHKILELTVMPREGFPRKFKDFMAFVPGSLKGIGKAFGLSVSKGDFPHVSHSIFSPMIPLIHCLYRTSHAPITWITAGDCPSCIHRTTITG